jgi:FkbH-like protein
VGWGKHAAFSKGCGGAGDGPKEEFLATLEMIFTIAPCREEDLKRAEELTVRTNQLNSTGFTYSYKELDELRQSPRHQLLISSLEDRHGTYDKIGLTLIEMSPEVSTVKLLLMSCRLMSKAVGMIMLHTSWGRPRKPASSSAPSSSPTIATARC